MHNQWYDISCATLYIGMFKRMLFCFFFALKFVTQIMMIFFIWRNSFQWARAQTYALDRAATGPALNLLEPEFYI